MFVQLLAHCMCWEAAGAVQGRLPHLETRLGKGLVQGQAKNRVLCSLPQVPITYSDHKNRVMEMGTVN